MKQILSQMFALFSHIMFFVVCVHIGEKVCASLAPTPHASLLYFAPVGAGFQACPQDFPRLNVRKILSSSWTRKINNQDAPRVVHHHLVFRVENLSALSLMLSSGRHGNLPLPARFPRRKNPQKTVKKRTAVQIYFDCGAPIATPQCIFSCTAVQFLKVFAPCRDDPWGVHVGQETPIGTPHGSSLQAIVNTF